MKVLARLPGWSYLGPWGVALLGSGVLALLPMRLPGEEPGLGWVIAGVGALAVGTLGAGLCARAAWAVVGGERRVWGLLAAAYTVNAVAVCAVAIERVGADTVPPLSPWIDVFCLLYYPLAAAALLVLAGEAGACSLKATTLLDAFILTLGIGVFIWGLATSFTGTATSDTLGPLAIAYLLGDSLLLFALVSLALSWEGPRPSVSFCLVAGSVAVTLIVDVVLLWMVSGGGWSGTHPATIEWWALPVVVGLAALVRLGGWSGRHAPPVERALAAGSSGASGTAEGGPNAQRVACTLLCDRAYRLRTLVPYLAFPLVAGFVRLHVSQVEASGTAGTAAVVWYAVVMLGLVSLRHFLALRDNRRLSGSMLELSQGLEEHVERRTAELAEQSRTLRERTDQVTTLNRVAARLSRALTSDQVVTTGLTMAFEATGCSAGVVWLRGDNGEGPLHLAARYGVPPELERALAELPEVEPAFPRVLATERACLLRAATSDVLGGMSSPTAADPMGDEWGLHLVPLVSRGEVLGIMGLVLDDADAFGETEQQLERSIAAQLAVALENARQYDRAVFMADHDALSGLLNHRALHARLSEELNRAQRSGGRFSILMVDLDSFKLFNDTYGHQIGDEVLTRVAETLDLTVRASDVVGRYGGDEFLAVLPDTDGRGAVDVAERLQDALYDTPFVAPDGLPVPLLCSVGVATYPDDGRRADELVAAADANLYTSKQQGGGAITAAQPPDTVEPAASGVFTVLDGLVTAVDNRDRYTRSHSDGVAQLSLAIANRMGLGEEDSRALRLAGLLHDVGKIGVPDRILRKPGRLTTEEYEVVKQHAVLSELIIKEIPHLDLVVGAVGAHHERFDGGGYPRGLRGDDIPLLGRILAVADAYSAMTTDRPYRKAMSPEEACAEVLRVAGSQLDPDLGTAFVDLVREGETGEITRLRAASAVEGGRSATEVSGNGGRMSLAGPDDERPAAGAATG